MDKMNWIDSIEKKRETEQSDFFFNIQEGDNKIQLLTHAAPLAQKWTGSKYEVAEEGDTNVSIKGICWVLQEGKIKQAKLPYTVVKAIRELQKDEDYTFDSFPMPRVINIKAKGAGTKEVEYVVVPSPKETEVPAEILKELKTKPTPEDIIEKIKGKVSSKTTKELQDEAAEDAPSPEDIPF